MLLFILLTSLLCFHYKILNQNITVQKKKSLQKHKVMRNHLNKLATASLCRYWPVEQLTSSPGLKTWACYQRSHVKSVDKKIPNKAKLNISTIHFSPTLIAWITPESLISPLMVKSDKGYHFVNKVRYMEM